MKKNVLSLGLIVLAALTLFTNCSKNEFIGSNDSLSSGDLFEITLTSEVKTTNNGMSTEWADGDAVNVFHAVAGTTDYVNDGKFDVSDAANGTFTGTLNGTLDSGKSYDWYVFYPYSSYITTPNNTSAGYSTVAEINQTQTGNNNTAHLKALPLAGKTTGVSGASSPSISMLNMASVIKVVVTNNSGVSLPVTTIKITTSSEKIAGRFFVNFVNPDSPVYTPATGSNSPSTAVNLKADQVIANASSATFFVAVRPFTAENGTTLKLKVEDYEKTSSITSNKVFKPGEINTFNFNYDKEQSIASLPFYISGAAGKSAYETEPGLSASGLGSNYAGSNSPYLTKFDTDGDYIQIRYDKPAEKVALGVKMLGGASASSIVVKGSSDGIAFTDIETLSISGDQNSTHELETTNAIDESYRFLRLVFKKGSNVGLGAFAVTKVVGTEPEIESKVVSGIPARGASGQTVDVSLTNYASAPTLAAIPDGTIITAASVTAVSATSATITYTIADNVSSDARAGTITVSDTDSHSGTITVNQVAAVFSVTRTSVDLNANAGAYTTVRVDSDFDWTIDDSSLSGFTVSPNSFTYNGDKAQTVTITATGPNANADAVSLGSFIVKRTADNSELSIAVSQKSAKLAAPSLTITPDAANNKFTVSWSAVGNAAKYEYYVLDEDANYKVPITQTADATTRSFEVTSITLNKEYVVSVKAVGDNNPWIDSDESNQTVKVTGAAREVISGTFTFANDKLSLTTESGITITQEKVSGNTSVSNSYNTATTLRVYVGHKLTFSGKTITKIEFTHTSSYKGSDGISSDVGQYTQDSTASSWTGSATSVSITNAGGKTTRQLRPTQIVVYYE